MAYIHGTVIGQDSGSSLDFTMPSDLAADDLLLLHIAKDGSGTYTLPTSPWTDHSLTSGTLGAVTHYAYWLKVGTPASSYSFAYSGTINEVQGLITIVRGAHTTDPFGGLGITDEPSPTTDVSYFSMPAATTSYDNSLILYAYGGHDPNSPFLPVQGDQIEFARIGNYGDITIGSTYTYQETAGAIPTPEWRGQRDTTQIDDATRYVLCIRDDGANVKDGYVSPSYPVATLLSVHGYKGGDGKNISGQYDPVTSLSMTTVDTVSTTYVSIEYSRESLIGKLIISPYQQLTSTATQAGLAAIGGTTFAASQNISGKIISFTAAPAIPSTNLGRFFGFGDGTNWKLWKYTYDGAVPDQSSSLLPFQIDVDTATALDSSGTLSTTAVTNILSGWQSDDLNLPGNKAGCIYALDTLSVVGGSSSRPSSFLTAYDVAKMTSLRTVQTQAGQSESQFHIMQDVMIGDGALDLYWDSENQAISFPIAESGSRLQAQVPAGSYTLTVKGASGNTIKLNSTTINFGNYHKFVLNSLAAIESSGLNILNSDVTLTNNASTALGGVTFSACKALTSIIDLSGGCTISNCPDTYAVTVTSEAEFFYLENCDLTNNNVAIQITGDQSGTWGSTSAWSGVTFSGNTTKLHYTGTTDFTIKVASSSNLSSGDITYGPGAGTITIEAPAKGIVFSGAVSGSQIVVCATGTQTERYRTNSATGSDTYTATVEESVDYTIMKAGYDPIRVTGYTVGATQTTVVVQQKVSRAYVASSGLTFTTNTTADTSLKQFSTNTATTVQNFYSHMIEEWIAQSSLVNVEFPIIPNGGNSFSFDNGWEFTSGSIQYLSSDGFRYRDTSDTLTATYCAILTTGNPSGKTLEYQQVDGAAPTDASNTGNMDQVVQIYGDATHGNFDYTGYMIIKAAYNGYEQAIADVVSIYGTLADDFYAVGVTPTALSGFTTGDPAPSGLTITHETTPVTWNGKDFSITITDTGANSGETIHRWINYNIRNGNDTTFEGEDPFNYFDLVVTDGDKYATQYGDFIGKSGMRGVRVIDGSGNAHSDFSKFQADDGTYYTVPVTATAKITSIVSGSRVRIYNETTATEVYNGTPGTSYTANYTDGTDYSSGDTVTIYITQTSTTTAQLPFKTTVVATSTGWTALAAQESDDVYDQYGLDGSTITKFTADYTGAEVDIVTAANFTATEFYAWWCYNLTTTQGISDFYGGVVANDAANINIKNAIVDIYLDNTTTTNIWQTDNIRIYRDDEAYPVRNPTTGGGGIDVVWRDKVYIANVGGSALTTAEKAQLSNAANAGNLVFTVSGEVDANVQSLNDQPLLGTGQDSDKWRG